MKRLLVVLFVMGLTIPAFAQNATGTGNPSVIQAQATNPYYFLNALTATAAAGSPAVLTIPAPSSNSIFNYVCSLAFEGSNANSAAVLTNAVSTNTNFGTFAVKVSAPSVASNDTANAAEGSAQQMSPILIINSAATGGCVKSTAGGTATVFTSPTVANWAFMWAGTYYQAP